MNVELESIFSIILMSAAAADLGLVCRRELMMFQQNSYRPNRYAKWFKMAGESTSPGRLMVLVALMILLVRNFAFVGGAGVASVVLAVQAFKLARAKYKKPLVFTRRAMRIYVTMLLLAVCVVLPVGLFASLQYASIATVACVVASPLLLLAANWLLSPIESYINRRYYNEAAEILRGMPELKIVGVTGSYGKTSTKHYLNRILSEKYDVVMTPGSFNTTLGVIRTVREYLKPYNEVFIVEMGAKQKGDIKEICDLVHPEIGIVTAVGEQHLESFKTIDNVQSTKFELVDSLPSDGLAVVNNDFEYGANRPVDNVACRRYAVKSVAGADFVATDIKYGPSGTTFTVKGDGRELTLSTKLVGECNISNLIAAVIVALHLEVPEEKIQYAVQKIEQVEHRLNVKRTPGGITIIDDAFNSNPSGSRMALEVLGMMEGGQRIVITPGMIELGTKQYEYNKVLGGAIAANADVAIVVGEYNREALLAGIEADNSGRVSVHAVSTFTEAQRLLSTIAKAGDFVLYENDLPDTFK